VKPVKMLIFVGMATICVSMIGGVGAVLAQEYTIGVCAAKEEVCEPKNAIDPPAGGSLAFQAESTNAVLTGTGIFETPQKCDESKVTVLSTEEMKILLSGLMQRATFEEDCSGCAVATIKSTQTIITLTAPDKLSNILLNVAVSGTMSECPFGAKCKFGAIEAELSVKNSESGTSIHAEKETLTLEEGSEILCGSTLTWDADYFSPTVELLNSEEEVIGKSQYWLALFS
jgi:hypothetical protein